MGACANVGFNQKKFKKGGGGGRVSEKSENAAIVPLVSLLEHIYFMLCD